MNLLDALEPDHRTLFEGAAQRVQLEPGSFLVRQGDPGGDLFVLVSGTLEAVDRRAGSEVVFTEITRGAVIGEIAFLDGSPRSVAVRASTPAEVLRWDRDELRTLLQAHPTLSARFHEFVARLAMARIRGLTTTTVSALTQADASSEADHVEPWVDRVAATFKQAMAPLETRLRSSPPGDETEHAVHDALDRLEQGTHAMFTALDHPPTAARAAERLWHEVQPYLGRARLAGLAHQRRPGMAGNAQWFDHVLAGVPEGEGRLGHLIDGWLHQRPTCVAVRQLHEKVVALATHGHHDTAQRGLVVGAPGLVPSLVDALGAGSRITVLDQSRTALDAAAAAATSEIAVHTQYENLVSFASGRAIVHLEPQDVAVIWGLLEYLPEPLAVSLLTSVRRCLRAEGRVVLGTMRASPDQVLLDRLLQWPMIRRTRPGVEGLLGAAGLRLAHDEALERPAHLVVASVDPALAARSGTE